MSSSSNSGERKPVIVIGLGNTLMGDEAVGVKIVQALEQKAARYPQVEFADYGTAGMRVLHGIAGREAAIVVDCAKMGAEAGDIRRFSPHEVKSIKAMPGFSLHEGDFLTVLRLSKELGEAPHEVVVFGIEPERVAPGESLSGTLDANFNSYLAAIEKEIRSRCMNSQ